MKQITLEDITQDAFDAASETVISGIKAYNRKLDTRDGTVLRDLLVNPESAIEAVTSGQIAEVRKSSSLKLMKDAQDAGEEIDQNDVDAILSNFNVKRTSGTPAKKYPLISISNSSEMSPSTIVSTSKKITRFSSGNIVARQHRRRSMYVHLLPILALPGGKNSCPLTLHTCTHFGKG